MKLSPTAIAVLLRMELISLLRDKRTVFMALVLPALILPVMLGLSRKVTQGREEREKTRQYSYAVTGANAEVAREILRQALERPPADAEAVLGGQPKESPKDAPANIHEHEGELDDPVGALRDHLIDLWIYAPEIGKKNTDDIPSIGPHEDAAVFEANAAKVLGLSLHYRGDFPASQFALDAVRTALRNEHDARRAGALKAGGMPFALSEFAQAAEADLASQRHAAGAKIGSFVTLLAMFLMLSGGAAAATDSIAGEKERGTLATLLSASVGRTEIVVAKLLAIFSVAMTIATVQGANLLVCGYFGLIDLPVDAFAGMPVRTALGLIVLLLPVAALVSGALLLTSGLANSYKEAQFFFLPLMIVLLVPLLVPLLSFIPLRSAAAFLPLGNIGLAVREFLSGRIDLPFMAIAWVTTLGAALGLNVMAARTLRSERLISGASRDAAALTRAALYPRHVMRWFGLFWAITFAGAANIPWLAGIRAQTLFNIGGVFLGGSLLLAYFYKLDFRKTFSLRAPKPAVWLAVIALAPGGAIAAEAVHHAANWLLPAPQSFFESFNQALDLDNTPLAQILFFMALLPGIGEEMAFRGALMHGLRKRGMGPIAVCLAVGVIFGLFHGDLFRLAPTGFLGAMLAAMVLLTGSIFPAMVWHASNNALGLLLAKNGIDTAYLPPAARAACYGLLLVGAWIVWRNRVARDVAEV